MSPRKRILLLVAIMIVVALAVESMAVLLLYRTAIEKQKANLRDIVVSQARLIEAVARFDRKHNRDFPGSSSEATLSQIVDAHSRYKGFGQTGEFTLSKKQLNEIVFILSHRHYDLNNPKPVPFESNLAQPARLALSGKSGTIVGLDYRGQEVLAAFEPVQKLGWAIVAKIDMTEVRAPFIKAAVLAGLLGLITIIIGAVIFIKTTEPLITELQNTVESLHVALDRVKQLSGLLPICASCKKIRDDKGYWTQIEAYIRDHSEAQFSHGICPDCARKIYQDMGKNP